MHSLTYFSPDSYGKDGSFSSTMQRTTLEGFKSPLDCPPSSIPRRPNIPTSRDDYLKHVKPTHSPTTIVSTHRFRETEPVRNNQNNTTRNQNHVTIEQFKSPLNFIEHQMLTESLLRDTTLVVEDLDAIQSNLLGSFLDLSMEQAPTPIPQRRTRIFTAEPTKKEVEQVSLSTGIKKQESRTIYQNCKQSSRTTQPQFMPFVNLLHTLIPILEEYNQLQADLTADKGKIIQTLSVIAQKSSYSPYSVDQPLLGRILTRLGCSSVLQALGFHGNLDDRTVESILGKLGEVQKYVEQFLNSQHNPVQLLRAVYYSIHSKQTNSQCSSLASRLSAILIFGQKRSSLQSVGFLDYIWHGMGHKEFSQQQFIQQFCRFQIRSKRMDPVSQALVSQGFTRM